MFGQNSLIQPILFACFIAGSSAFATVTLQFSNPFDGGIASGFSNRTSATGVDGLQWGIVVDGSGNGFGSGSYFNLAGGTIASGFLSLDGINPADDYFFLSSSPTQNFSVFEELDGVSGGPGTIGEVASVPFGSFGIGLGKSFALIWFDSTTADGGDYYGFLTHPSFLIPADGSTTSFDSPFLGVDPVRNATFQFQAIPEPSRALLLGLAGMIGLMRRRRRKA